MSDTDLLRRAAAHAREAATAATEGPWKAHDTSLDNGGHTATVLTKRERVIDNTLVSWLPTFSHEPWNDNTNAWADSTHIALWHPGVALAVADWLESEATSLEHHLPAWDGTHWRERNHPEEPAPRGYRNPGHVAALVEHHYRHPLAVACALLGEDTQ